MKIQSISGFPEWTPAQEVIAQRFMSTIRGVFKAHGFSPLETPAVERVSSLTSKGGGENEQEIYALRRLHGSPTDDKDLGLHFDLTVPLARYVAQHEMELAFPFARYQMQKVWRGERAQADRFREFYQCDIDVIGRGSLPIAYDAKVAAVMADILTMLDIGLFQIRVNNRKMLQGFLESCGIHSELHKPVMKIIDRLDKIGAEAVTLMLHEEAGIERSIASVLMEYPSQSLSKGALGSLAPLSPNELFEKGKAELSEMLMFMEKLSVPESVIVIDTSIARGLDYYTGNVYETRLVNHPGVGSICSGGRYDNLVERFSDRPFPGVGMSIGLTRLLSRLFAEGVIEPKEASFAHAVVYSLDSDSFEYRASIARKLRNEGLSIGEFFGNTKLAKQIEYALRRGIRFGLIAGSTERDKQTVIIKDHDLNTQEEFEVTDISGIINQLK